MRTNAIRACLLIACAACCIPAYAHSAYIIETMPWGPEYYYLIMAGPMSQKLCMSVIKHQSNADKTVDTVRGRETLNVIVCGMPKTIPTNCKPSSGTTKLAGAPDAQVTFYKRKNPSVLENPKQCALLV